MVDNDPLAASVKRDLIVAINRFIIRQELVAQAFVSFGLNLQDIGNYGAFAWGSTPERDLTPFEVEARKYPEMTELLRVVRHAHALQLAQKGVWHDNQGNTWHYFLHGKGCQLTNTQTREPIDWDCPDVTQFDAYFFIYHLAWQLLQVQYEHNYADLRLWVKQHGIERIPKMIEEMMRDGLIVSLKTHE